VGDGSERRCCVFMPWRAGVSGGGGTGTAGFFRGGVVLWVFFGVLVLFSGGTAPGGALVSWGSQKTADDELNDVVKIAAGGYHSLALKSDGSVVGWGANWYGKASPPVGDDFAGVAGGRSHSLAVRNGVGRQWLRSGERAGGRGFCGDSGW